MRALIKMKLKVSMAGHAYNLSTWVVGPGRSGIQGYLYLHGKSKASLGYIKYCLKK